MWKDCGTGETRWPKLKDVYHNIDTMPSTTLPNIIVIDTTRAGREIVRVMTPVEFAGLEVEDIHGQDIVQRRIFKEGSVFDRRQ